MNFKPSWNFQIFVIIYTHCFPKMKSSINKQTIYYLLFFYGALLLIAYIVIVAFNFNSASATSSGAIGDTFSGIAAPFIGIMGVLLTFLAFWVQFEANERQRGDIRRERFENKFYELLRLHKENVNEINIFSGTYTGRSAFIKMYEEYRDIFNYALKVNEKLEPHQALDKEQIHEFAYLFFFIGIGRSTQNSFNVGSLHQSYINALRIELESIQTAYDKYLEDLKDEQKDIKSFPFKYDNNKGHTLNYKYRPFDGHLSRLGHYYRHLFQMVKFVIVNNDLNLKNEEKYQYLKTLRATLSNHEQVMLYYNTFGPPGNKWWADTDKDYKGNEVKTRIILDYKMIKNIPLHLTAIGIKPEHKFRAELKKAHPDKKEQWYDKRTFESFEGYENLFG